jgi:hypothetical protein
LKVFIEKGVVMFLRFSLGFICFTFRFFEYLEEGDWFFLSIDYGLDQNNLISFSREGKKLILELGQTPHTYYLYKS